MVNRLNNVHAGNILKEEFLIPLNLSYSELSENIDIDIKTIKEIINGTKKIDVFIAAKLAGYFNTSIQFWMNL